MFCLYVFSNGFSYFSHMYCSQGFLNTCVYVYSNRTMMKWLRSNLVCVRFTRPRFISSSTTGPRHSIDRHVENGWRGEGTDTAEGEEKAPESTTDSELDDLDDDTEWLSTPSKPARKTLPVEGTTEVEAEDPHQVVNVLVTTRVEGENSYSSKSQSQNSAMSSNTNRKSILIPEKSAKNIDSKSKRNSAHYYPDVDSEKFVRFGK